MITIEIEIVGTAECSDIEATIQLNSRVLALYQCSLKPCVLTVNLDDQASDNDLTIVMQGKTDQHTVVSQDGTIEQDASILISRLEFEHIDMMPIYCQGRQCYWHSNNQAEQQPKLDEFYGYMGCNGTVHIEFQTPMYLWFNQHFSD